MVKRSRKRSRYLRRSCNVIECLEKRTLMSGYTLAKVASFTDSGDPIGSLTSDSAGDLFGVTRSGGINSAGSVFEIAAGSSKVITLASFGAASASGGSIYPNPILVDASGNVFGTTDLGGDTGNNAGSVFEVVDGSGQITILASFNADNSANTTGSFPQGNIIMDANGDLFGTTTDGGNINTGGGGTYWEFNKSTGTLSAVADFAQLTNNNGLFYGANPGYTMMDPAGDVFGTAEGNADAGFYGYVWEIPANTNTINTLATFNGADGSEPLGPIAIDLAGDVFGTTQYGGGGQVADSESGDGVAWEVKANSGVITDLANFTSTTGSTPTGVTMDSSGDLFGNAFSNGADTLADGTSWEIADAGTSLAPTINPLVSFGPIANGQHPNGGLLLGPSGNLFGTTSSGGSAKGLEGGDVFELVAPGNALPTGTPIFSPVVARTNLPASVVAGSTTHYTAVVNLTNSGSGVENGTGTVTVFASANGVIDTASIKLGSATRRLSDRVGGILPVLVSIPSIPIGLDDSYTLLAEVTDAFSNTRQAATGPVITIAPPYLSFADTYVKTTLGALTVSGQTTRAYIQLRITNHGNIISRGSTGIAIYASVDDMISNGIFIINDPTSVILKPGASRLVDVLLKAIPDVADGNYYLIGQVTDPQLNITTVSSPTTYNLAAPIVMLVPTITSVTLPSPLATGAKYRSSLVLTITNQGNIAPISASTILVFASTTGAVAGGTELVMLPFRTRLAPGRSTRVTTAITGFSGLPAGGYFLAVQIIGPYTATVPAVSLTTYTVTG